jgi:hypothetical protein
VPLQSSGTLMLEGYSFRCSSLRCSVWHELVHKLACDRISIHACFCTPIATFSLWSSIMRFLDMQIPWPPMPPSAAAQERVDHTLKGGCSMPTSESTLARSLARLPMALHPAVCSADAVANGGTLHLRLGTSSPQLQQVHVMLVAAALPRLMGPHRLQIEMSGEHWLIEGPALAALESLLAAAGQACSVHVATRLDIFMPCQASSAHEWLLPRFARCLQLMEKSGLRELRVRGKEQYTDVLPPSRRYPPCPRSRASGSGNATHGRQMTG